MKEVRAGLFRRRVLLFVLWKVEAVAPPVKEGLAGGQSKILTPPPTSPPSPEEKSECRPDLRLSRLSPEQTKKMRAGSPAK
jgi:hypothetical protein